MRRAALLGALAALAAGCPAEEKAAQELPIVSPPIEDVPALPGLSPPSHAATTPLVIPASPDVEKTLEVLRAVVQTHANDPENPWAVAHGLLALGPSFTVRSGEPAVDYLFSRYAKIGEIQGHTLPYFPRTEGAIKIEPHTDLLLKNFTEIGVSPDQVVTVQGRSFEVGDAWHHTMLTTFLKKQDGSSSYDSPNDMPWGVQALAAWAPPGLRWRAFDGTEMSIDELARLMVHVLTSESGFMIAAMSAGQDFEKKGQGIFQYTCGGAHLLQGSTFVVARGLGGDAERDKIRVQGQLLFYRFPRELAIYKKAMDENPTRKLVLMVQQLKFVGHWLESTHKLLAAGLYTPSPSDQLIAAEAVNVLVGTTRELKALGAFDNLDAIRPQNEQLYLDIVGDASHAIRGLELALGRQTFSY